MGYSLITEKLAKKWDIDYYDAERVLYALGAVKWAGGEGLSCITHVGTIDNGHTDKIAGHNGYCIVDAESRSLCYVTNGDSVWTSTEDEEAILECGFESDEFCPADDYMI